MDKALVYINGKPKLMDEVDLLFPDGLPEYIDSEDMIAITPTDVAAKLPFHRNPNEGPAICWSNGSEWYYVMGKPHRENGPAIINTDGPQEYWVNGILHREEGPAKVWADGSGEYYKHGKLHRVDGPAIEHINHSVEFWLNGRSYEFEDWEKERKMTEALVYIEEYK